MSHIIQLSRDLMGAFHSITGERASAKLLVNSTTAATLAANTTLVPIVNGAARDDLLFKIAVGPNAPRYREGIRVPVDGQPTCGSSWWNVQPGGTLVNVVSNIGGHRHNLPADTKFVFDPIVPGIEPQATLYDAAVGGADPTHLGGCKTAMIFESLTGASATLDAFRAKLGKLPGVVLVWDSSEPADGTTQSTLDRGASRAGTGRTRYRENFNLFVISERFDSGHMRRAEGVQLLEDLSSQLIDRTEVDGRALSNPGIQITGRSRVTGDNATYQAIYVYVLQVAVTGSLEMKRSREFTPWLRSHIVTQTHDTENTDGTGDRKVVVDQLVDMTSDTE